MDHAAWLARFMSHVVVSPTGCWFWNNEPNRYGSFYYDGRRLPAHRASLILHSRPITDELFACHRCDVRGCVNPDHLFMGTHQENMDDMAKKGRAAKGPNLLFAICPHCGLSYKVKRFLTDEQKLKAIARTKRWRQARKSAK